MAKKIKDGDSVEVGQKDSLIAKGRQVISALKYVTVEPSGLFLMTTTLMNYIMSTSLILDRACRVNNNFTSETCDNIKNNIARANYTEEEKMIQHVVSNTQIYKSLFVNICPIVYVLFLGPWSDTYGRKLPLLLPTIGYVLQSLLLVLFSVVESADAYTIALTSSILTGVVGGSNRLFSMAATGYIADTSKDHVRTVRLGLYRCCSAIGLPLGFAIGGLLTKSSLAPEMTFVISTFIALAALLFVVFGVKNGARDMESGADNQTAAKAIIDKRHILQVLKVPFRKRENGGRVKLLLLLLANICLFGPFQGEFKVIYLFLRYKLGWDTGDYGTFSVYNSIMMVGGTFLSLGILSHALKLKDPVVGFIAGFSQLGGAFIYAFSYTSFMIYLASTVDMMNGTMMVVVKAMISKLVDDDEQGKIFAVVCIVEAVTPYVMDPTYITLYKHTFTLFAGSFFLLSAALSIPPQIIFLVFIWRKWTVGKVPGNDEQTEDTESTLNADEKDKMFVDVGTTNEVQTCITSDEKTTEIDAKSESIGLMTGEIKSSKTSLKE